MIDDNLKQPFFLHGNARLSVQFLYNLQEAAVDFIKLHDLAIDENLHHIAPL